MKFPPSLKPGIWGAVIGAAAISVLGFSTFGWTLGSTAERMVKERAQTAVVDVLAPICVEKFQQQADAPAKLVEFNKVPSFWDRRLIIEKGGWATMAGTDTPNSAVATALRRTACPPAVGVRTVVEMPSSGPFGARKFHAPLLPACWAPSQSYSFPLVV
jgi:hypothetical protein